MKKWSKKEMDKNAANTQLITKYLHDHEIIVAPKLPNQKDIFSDFITCDVVCKSLSNAFILG